jgi:hypothetical protein
VSTAETSRLKLFRGIFDVDYKDYNEHIKCVSKFSVIQMLQ